MRSETRWCLTTNLSHYLSAEQARYYGCYGAGRRMIMMWYSYRHLIFTAYPERTDPLTEEEAQEIAKDVKTRSAALWSCRAASRSASGWKPTRP